MNVYVGNKQNVRKTKYGNLILVNVNVKNLNVGMEEYGILDNVNAYAENIRSVRQAGYGLGKSGKKNFKFCNKIIIFL